MATEEVTDLAQLQSNLHEYEAQLEQVEGLLLDDPDNEEYKGIYESLAEVIALTRDLIKDAEAAGTAAGAAASDAAMQPPRQQQLQPQPLPVPATVPLEGAITQAPEVRLPSVLPPQVAQQIKEAQQRAALLGQAPPAWAIGAPCQAMYSGDGQWYNAVIEAVSASSNFVIAFEGYDTREEVERQAVRMRPPADSEPAYRPVSAPRRHVVAEEVQVEEMPKWLEIKEGDDEKTKAKKRKLQKSFKSKARFARMDLQQKHKAESWRSFFSGKASKKKPKGFMTSLKRESMFKVPEGGKVGVIGSGKGTTEFAKKRRHEFSSVDGSGAGED